MVDAPLLGALHCTLLPKSTRSFHSQVRQECTNMADHDLPFRAPATRLIPRCAKTIEEVSAHFYWSRHV